MASSQGSYAEQRRRAAGRRTFQTEITWSPESREADDGSLLLRGTAAVFDSKSHDLGGFTETLAPGCFTRALRAPGSDQFLLWSHDPDAILARRSAGTLNLAESDRGLEIEARLVPTQLARDVHLLVRTGHATGMSFGFTVARDQWSGRGKNTSRRVLEVGSLFEVTVTPSPAYPAASVKTRDRAQLATELADLRQRARNVLANTETKEAEMPKNNTRRGPRTQVVTTRDPYAPGSPYSWFRDQLEVAHDAQRQRHARDTGTPSHIRDAQDRIRDSHDSRSLTTTGGAGGDFTPTGEIPTNVAEAFGTSARARAVVTASLPTFPMPDGTGATIGIPRITSQGAAGVQASQGDARATASPTTSLASTPIITIAGEIEISQQALDRAVPGGFDTAISAELGEALAERVEVQVLNGTGSGGQLTGLISQAGTTVTYTTGTPTCAGVISRLGQTISGVHQAAGILPDLIAMHPRRLAWLNSQSDAQGQPIQYRLGVPIVGAAALPLDANSHDQALVVTTTGIRLYLGAPQITVIADYSGTATLTGKVIATQYVALALPKGTVSVGKLTGTGLADPSFA